MGTLRAATTASAAAATRPSARTEGAALTAARAKTPSAEAALKAARVSRPTAEAKRASRAGRGKPNRFKNRRGPSSELNSTVGRRRLWNKAWVRGDAVQARAIKLPSG